MQAAGVTGVNLSLDHWDPSAHDRFRCTEGAHSAVVEGLRVACEVGLATAVTVTMTPETADPGFLRRHLEYAGELGASLVRWLEPRAVGRWHRAAVDIPEHQLRAVLELWTALNRDHPELPIIDYPDGERHIRGTCLAANERALFVDARGQLHACPFCRDPVANIVHEGLPAGLVRLEQRGCHALPTPGLDVELRLGDVTKTIDVTVEP